MAMERAEPSGHKVWVNATSQAVSTTWEAEVNLIEPFLFVYVFLFSLPLVDSSVCVLCSDELAGTWRALGKGTNPEISTWPPIKLYIEEGRKGRKDGLAAYRLFEPFDLVERLSLSPARLDRKMGLRGGGLHGTCAHRRPRVTYEMQEWGKIIVVIIIVIEI